VSLADRLSLGLSRGDRAGVERAHSMSGLAGCEVGNEVSDGESKHTGSSAEPRASPGLNAFRMNLPFRVSDSKLKSFKIISRRLLVMVKPTSWHVAEALCARRGLSRLSRASVSRATQPPACPEPPCVRRVRCTATG
jgi:hypothetical protein